MIEAYFVLFTLLGTIMTVGYILSRRAPKYSPSPSFDRAIRAMKPGESAYTLRWAFTKDRQGDVWVRGDYPAYDHPSQNFVKITRMKECVIVEASIGDLMLASRPFMEAWKPLRATFGRP